MYSIQTRLFIKWSENTFILPVTNIIISESPVGHAEPDHAVDADLRACNRIAGEDWPKSSGPEDQKYCIGAYWSYIAEQGSKVGLAQTISQKGLGSGWPWWEGDSVSLLGNYQVDCQIDSHCIYIPTFCNLLLMYHVTVI